MALWSRISGDELWAGNGEIGLEFVRRGRTILLSGLVDEASGQNLAAGGPLWEIEFGPRGRRRVVVDGSRARRAEMRLLRRRGRLLIRLLWHDVPVGSRRVRVVAEVDLPARGKAAEWRLSVRGQTAFRLWRISFPRLAVTGSNTSLALPAGWGLNLENALAAKPLRATYPSVMGAMPWLAAYGERAGVYLGAHDPAAGHKQLVFTPDPAAGTLSLEIVTFPARTGEPRKAYRLPYPAAVEVFSGRWFEAAACYRRWVRSAPYSRPVQPPRWLEETDLWCLASGGPETAASVRKFAEYFGVPTAVHWYNWHEIPFDTAYPKYFPTKPGFAAAVRDLQKRGLHVMPYINGRLWDPATKSWRERDAKAAAAKNEKGKPYIEVYGSKVPLAVMCPTTSLWQRTVRRLVDRLVTEVGVDGVYIDQISAAPAVLCFDPGHPHPPGGGDIWSRGYRRLLQRIRAALPAGKMLTTEECADPWMDLLDAFLLVNTPADIGELVPLFPAIHGARTILFGFQYIVADDLDRSLPFRAKMARNFVWGGQLGWVGPHLLEPKYRREAEYLRALARCRAGAHRYFVRGEMLPPPRLEPDRRVTVEGIGAWGGSYSQQLHPVQAAAWRGRDNSVGLALTNFTDRAERVTVSLAGYRPRRLTLPPRSARVVPVT